jgi:hypothetical protein
LETKQGVPVLSHLRVCAARVQQRNVIGEKVLAA